jgi:Tol biopolymer transport system component
LGGSVQKLVDTGFSSMDGMRLGTIGAHPWLPDGSALLFSRRGEDGTVAIWKIDIASRKTVQLTHPGSTEVDMAATLTFAGDRIVFCRSGDEQARLMTMPLDGGEPKEVVRRDTDYLLSTWSPDGDAIVFSEESGGLWMADYPLGKTRQLTAGTIDEIEPVVATDGRILYSTFSHQTDIYIDDMNGGEDRLTRHTLDNFSACFAPDGNYVAYMSSRTGNAEIWLIDLAKQTERQLTSGEGRNYYPSCSPDGREVVFVSNRDGSPNAWSVSIDGGVPRKITEKTLAGLWAARWSPDGKRFGFISQEGPEPVLSVMEGGAGEPREVLSRVGNFDWYRDGSHIVYTVGGPGAAPEMRVANIDTGKEVTLLRLPHRELKVAPDGSSVSYVSAESHFNMNLHVLALTDPSPDDGLPRAAGDPERVTRGDGLWHVHNGGWSPDGKRVVYTRDTDKGDVHILDGVFAE